MRPLARRKCKGIPLENGVPLKDVMRMQVESLAPSQVINIAFDGPAGL